MEFFLDIHPPTVTAQEHKVRVVRGKPMFYDTARLKAARSEFQRLLSRYRPETPLEGPVALTVDWYFSTKSHREGAYRMTRPDTDNLQKLSFMHIHRIDPVIIDDRTKSRTGKCNLSMGIFSLKKICMISCRKCIFSEIIQSQQSTEPHTTHSAH